MIYISPSYLALIEQGKRTVTIDVLSQISKVCDVSTDYLLFGTSEVQDNNNFKKFQRLSEIYPPQKISNALTLAECYLTMK